MERPDSALVVLESMDLDMLTTERDRAHHALLHAMALDKNYIDVVDDSLAKTALTYFSKKGPEKYKARALYYLGLSYYYAGDYDIRASRKTAFKNCTSLKTFNFKKLTSLIKIGQGAFYGCNALEELTGGDAYHYYREQ